MKKLFISILIIFSMFSLSSCFDLVEEISMNANGSGTIKGTMNLSKSKTKVASLMKLDKIDGFKIPKESDIRKEITSIVNILKNTRGISNVNSRVDFTNFIVSISCDFKNVQALNAYGKAVATHFKSNFDSDYNYSYDPKTNTFIRSYKPNASLKAEFSKLSKENQNSFNQAFYTSIYRFEKAVWQQSNKAAKLSPNKKAVMLKVSVPSLVSGQTNLGNSIKLH